MRTAALLVGAGAALLTLALVLFDSGDDGERRGATGPRTGDGDSARAPAVPEGPLAPVEPVGPGGRGAPEGETRQPEVAPGAVPEPETERVPRPVGRPGRLVGRCVDQGLNPLADCRVTLVGRAVTEHTDDEGRFAFELALGDGKDTDRLRVERAGFGAVQHEVFLGAGETTDVGDVLLRATGVLAGRVLRPDGAPYPGARVQVEEALDLARGDRFEGLREPLVEGAAGAGGRFRLEAVPAGRLRVWAGAEGARWSVSESLELQPLQELGGLELVVHPLEPEDVIELVVLRPDGSPAAGARVDYRYNTGSHSGSGSFDADEEGRARRFLHVRAAHDLLAIDREQRLRPAVARGVVPGTRDLVLRLGNPEAFTLEVRGVAGAPVEEFSVRVIDDVADSWSIRPLEARDALRGAVRIVTPVFPFRLRVEAEGYELAELGPYDPATVGERLQVRLEPLPGITGRVLADGRPVAGASVSLHAAVAPGRRYSVNGFPARYHVDGPEGRSAADGTFRLTLREAGSYYLRAQAPGRAAGDAGPFALDPGEGARDLVVELMDGGGIEGRVLVPPGEELAGRIVGLSRGDGFGFTGRTDANGRFHFEGLTPGTWQVEGRSEEIRADSVSTTLSSADGEVRIPWNAEVRAGRTTSFDLDLRAASEATVVGRVLLGGRPPEDWRASLVTPDSVGSAAWVSLDPDGSFRIPTPAVGPARLVLMGRLDRTAFASVEAELVVLPGENPWSLEPATGALRGRLLAGEVEADSLVVRRSGPPGVPSFSARVVPAPDGTFALTRFPAGSLELGWRRPDGSEATRALLLAEGETLDVRLP